MSLSVSSCHSFRSQKSSKAMKYSWSSSGASSRASPRRFGIVSVSMAMVAASGFFDGVRGYGGRVRGRRSEMTGAGLLLEGGTLLLSWRCGGSYD